MIINPLNKNNTNSINEEKSVYFNREKVINEIIEYILEKHSSMLNEISFNEKNKEIIENIIIERLSINYSQIESKEIFKDIVNRFFGYYILQKYIDNKDVSDIRVIDYKTIFIKINGNWIKTEESFLDEKEYVNFVRYCILKNGGKINNEIPIIVVSDKKNNLRIEAGIEPVNVISPNLVIRIHRPENFKNLEDLLTSQSYMFDYQIYTFLIKCMIAGVNIVISGKGASGKTTLLRGLINKIPNNVAITSNEETAELFCKHENLIQREIIQNRTKEKNISLEMLSKQCLVMSNDAIIIGELKGQETMMFLDAIATGHRGYATVHSNSSFNTISRLITLMKRDKNAKDYSPKYLEQILANSIEIIIYMKNFKIQEITEIGYDYEKDQIIYNPIVKFNIEKIIENKSIGYYSKMNELKFTAKEKIDLSTFEINKIMEE